MDIVVPRNVDDMEPTDAFRLGVAAGVEAERKRQAAARRHDMEGLELMIGKTVDGYWEASHLAESRTRFEARNAVATIDDERGELLVTVDAVGWSFGPYPFRQTRDTDA